MTRPKWMESFDRDVADRFLSMNDSGGGLPGYLGFRFVAFEPGRLHAEMKVRDELLTPFGNLHGGVLAAFCDHVLGCVCYPHMRQGQWAATTEFKINYLASVSAGALEAHAEIVSLTRTTGVVRVEIRNESRTAGIAQGTVLIRDPR